MLLNWSRPKLCRMLNSLGPFCSKLTGLHTDSGSRHNTTGSVSTSNLVCFWVVSFFEYCQSHDPVNGSAHVNPIPHTSGNWVIKCLD